MAASLAPHDMHAHHDARRDGISDGIFGMSIAETLMNQGLDGVFDDGVGMIPSIPATIGCHRKTPETPGRCWGFSFMHYRPHSPAAGKTDGIFDGTGTGGAFAFLQIPSGPGGG